MMGLDWAAFAPWFVFALLGAGAVAFMLSTGESWWFGKKVSRAEEPRHFWSSVRGVALASTGSAVAAIVSLLR